MSVFVSLGSNMGDCTANLEHALAALAALPSLRVVNVSPVYRTEPQGLKSQAWFYNAVAELECGAIWSPVSFVRALLDVESRMGRVRVEGGHRFEPRTIDIDLLLYYDCVSQDPTCLVPHPRLLERAFVLVPLHDIAPEVMLPDGLTPQQALEKLQYSVQGNVIFQA